MEALILLFRNFIICRKLPSDWHPVFTYKCAI